MATLPRPGVEISQEVIVQSPTVLTPSLVPCITGPCFQIVEPIDDEGALNSQASVSTAARAVSAADISQPLLLRGREFVISVNSGDDQVISMPAAMNGDFSMSFALVVNTINKQLTGAVAEIVPGVVDGVAQPSKLVLRTTAKGPTASVTLRPHPDGDASSAYGSGADDIVSMNGLEGTAIEGQTSYTNISYNIPYTSFPSPMTSADECVWVGDDIAVYRYFGSSLYELSTNSATSWNAYTLAPSKIHGVNISSSMQPAAGSGKTNIWGVPGTGSKTNRIANIGSSASITIPLAHNISEQHTDTDVSWPDVTGLNYLKVSALGFTDEFLASGSSDDLGNLIGNLGNSVQVVFVDGGTDAISWNSGSKVLTITIDAATTFDQLAALIDDTFKASIKGDISVELFVADGIGTKSCRGVSASAAQGPWASGGATFHLHGGSDPADFSANAKALVFSGADDERMAWVAGSVEVGNATAAGLGIGGKTLSISIDGATAIDILLAPSVSVLTTIDNALGTVADATLETARTPLGESVQVLKINTVSTNGHDSTIEISASSDLCLERLLGGWKSATDTIASVNTLNSGTVTGLNAAAATRRWGVLGGSNFNTLAGSSTEQAIESGSLSIVTDGLALASIRTSFDLAAVAAQNAAWAGTYALKIDIEGSVTDTLSIALVNGELMEAVVGKFNTDIAAGGLNGLIIAHEANGSLCFTRTGATIAADQTIVLDYATVVAGAVGTSTNTEALLGTVGDAVATTTACTLTIEDTGVGNALQVTSINPASLSAPCPKNAPTVTSVTQLTEYFLGGATSSTNSGGVANRGDKLSLIEYSEGDITIVTAGDSVAGTVASALPVSFGFTSAGKAIISYNKVWPCSFGPTSPTYNSRLYHGRSNQVMTADMLWNNGSVLGRVVGVEDWAVSLDAAADPFPGAQLVISEFAVDKGVQLDKWYVVAKNLISGTGDDSGNNLRPEPEAEFSDLTQVYSIKPGVNRNAAGIAVANSSAPVYAKVKALRKDVSADTANPGLMVFGSIDEVTSLIGPIDPANPLAFGLYLAFLNTTDITLSALGVSSVSADAPNGTLEAYAEALDFLELHEVYAIAPMTHDMEVFKLLNLHVTSMSEPTGKLERMGIVCPSIPTEESSTLVGSAEFKIAGIGGGKYKLTIADGAAAAAFNIPMAIDGNKNAAGSVLSGANGSSYLPSDGVYVDREGDAFQYLVVGTPSADTIVIETSDVYSPGEYGPGTSGNDDSYYRVGTDAVGNLSTFEVDGELCTIKVRQAGIDISGTAGKLKACDTLGEIAGGVSGFQNRRMVMIQPEQVGVSIGGTEALVPGYYLGAGIAGMIGQQNPSQPFTNLPMVGFTRPVGSSDLFSENQMSTGAAGGIYWVVQDIAGGSCISRHQLTTDVSSLKTRELSILKSVDYVAKLLRTQVKRFIGRNNITAQLLETIGLSLQSSLASVSGSVVASANLDSLEQSSAGPDEIIAGVSLVPFYPANKIKLTIVI